MRAYFVTVNVMAPYPREYQSMEQASSIATAASRAIRKAKRELGRKRGHQWTVKILPA